VSGYVLERTRGEAFTPYIKRAVLEPLGLEQSAFELQPSMRPKLAKGLMWTMDGRALAAPTFPLGVGPSANLYSTVLDLGRFVEILLARGVTPEGRRVLPDAMLNAMWTPQLVPTGTRHGFGIGFDVGEIDGHRTVGHAGAIYGFASSLIALPDDSLGVVVISALDATNAVTERIAHSAIRLLLDARRGQALAAIDTTGPMTRERALSMMGRYESSKGVMDLDEFDGRSLLTPGRGGTRGTVRVLGNGNLIVDDELAFGPPVRVLTADRIVVGDDTLTRRVAPEARVVPVVTTKPPLAPADFASMIGEYGEDYNVLYIREKDGKLSAVIEWFLEYPLERVSRDVYRTPSFGLYALEDITFKRDARGVPTSVTVGYVSFKRRPLPGDDDRVSFRITPVRPPAELRREALAASPPAESRQMRQPDLVELRSLDSSIKYDIRYATSNNFMGVPFYTSAHAFLQRPAAEAVVRAAGELRKLGYGLLIHDAYRPWYVTKMFWDGTPPDKHMFVADPSQGSRHNRGCAVDLTLYDLKTGAPIRMTGGYDEMSDRSYPLYPGGTSSQRWHRDLLRHAMEAQGFRVIDTEWWHFDYRDWRSYPIGNSTFEQLRR
jgi:D-alanyl-D-alanine dipeptidase